MSNDVQVNSELELVEKLAVVVVFFLAALLLWQFLGGKDVVEKITESADEVPVMSQPKKHRSEEENTIDVVQEKTTKDKNISETISRSRESKSETKRSAESSGLVQNPKEHISNNISRNKEIVPPITERVVEQKKNATPLVAEKKTVLPTMQPISSNLSDGVLKLSGNGEAGARLVLLLNGKIFSDIHVDRNGFWKYEEKLEPGEYSVQVLTAGLNEKIKNQAALARISIPETKPEVEKKIKAVQKEIFDIKNKIQQTEAVKSKLISKKASRKINNKFYHVKYGDTLNGLSKRYRVSVQSLIQANEVSDKNVIEINQKLIIPGHYSGNE